MISANPAMVRLYAMLDVVAPTPVNVLILGETGVGKDVYATALHARSERAQRPFLQLNCAALPEHLLEGELFGYERGAFTGAVQAKAGLFEAADGGTVLLDEVGELPPTTQAKLLRVLETREVMRLGAVRCTHVDVRFVAATNRDLPALIRDQRFRADLYFRLDGVSITIPPLRERRDEIARLATAFARRAAATFGRAPVRLTDAALARLERHDWPGNVRELKHVIERAVLFCTTETLEASDLGALGLLDSRPGIATPAAPPDELHAAASQLRTLQRQQILDALARAAGNQTRAAKALGLSRFQLMRRLADHGVDRPRKLVRDAK